MRSKEEELTEAVDKLKKISLLLKQQLSSRNDSLSKVEKSIIDSSRTTSFIADDVLKVGESFANLKAGLDRSDRLHETASDSRADSSTAGSASMPKVAQNCHHSLLHLG